MLLRLMMGLLLSLAIVSTASAGTGEKSGMGFTYYEKMDNAGSKSAGVRGVLRFNGHNIRPSTDYIKTPIGSFHYVESNLPWKPQGWFPMEDIVAPNSPEPVTDEMLQKGSYAGGSRTGTPADWCYLTTSNQWIDPRQLTQKSHPSASCRLKPVIGPCKGLIEAYYYDRQSRSCKPFFWGGCQGVVPFKTIEECNNECPLKN